MSLLTVDLSSAKKLSLKDAKLPDPEVREPISTTPKTERPPTGEEVIYKKLALINPHLHHLVEQFDLVSIRTGERIDKPSTELAKVDYDPASKDKLTTLANKVMKEQEAYSKEDIICRLQEETKVNRDRAENGFALMLAAGAIKQSNNPEVYYLADSTPF